MLQVGQDGVSDAVVSQADAQLDAHELIKVKIGESSPQDRHEAADMLAARTQAQVAQVLGRTVLLYRPRKDKPQIVLPR